MSRSAAIADSAVLTTAMSSISIAVAAQTTVSVQRWVAVIGAASAPAPNSAAWSWAKCEKDARRAAGERAHGVGGARHHPGPLRAEERDDRHRRRTAAARR